MKEHTLMDLKISKFLRIGVLISGLLMAAGWLFNLKWDSNIFLNYQEYDPIPLQNFILYHYNQGQWASLISYAGLIVLILLPLIRVLLTGIIFIRQKEYLLAIIAATVLIALCLSFSLGIEL